MAIYQGKPKRKITGGRYRNRTKKLHSLGNLPTNTKLGEANSKLKTIKGGKAKLVALSTNKVNIYDPKTKKCVVQEIKLVIENPANRHLVRRNVITKGTIVTTELGKVKITSRPGQGNSLSGILL